MLSRGLRFGHDAQDRTERHPGIRTDLLLPPLGLYARSNAPAAQSSTRLHRAGVCSFTVSSTTRMSRRRQLYDGNAKILYEGPEPGTLIQYFKDDSPAFNAQKQGTIQGKGVLYNPITNRRSQF